MASDSVPSRMSKGELIVPSKMVQSHEYLSTSCLHHQHDYCQSVTGSNGTTEWVKTPSSCKFCDAPCICQCHREEDRVVVKDE
jgi:hypothetical protein